LGLAAEWLFGRAQDVEWAIADGQIWIVQSRPVTGVDPAIALVPPFPVEWEDETERWRSWMLLPSARGDLPLPLQQDYDAAAIGAWTDASVLGGGARFTPARMCCGRGYVARCDGEMHAGDRHVRAAALADLAARLRAAGATFWDYWGPEVVSAVERLRAFLQTVDEAGDGDLAEKIDDAFGLLRRHWGVHALLADGEELLLAPYFAAYAAVTDPAGGSARSDAVALLAGEDTAFTRLVDALYQLAELARAEPAVAALVAACPPDALSQLAALPAAAAFREAFAVLLAEYGERTGTGVGARTSLATPTWREDPLLVLRCLAGYLDPAVAPREARARVRARQATRFAAICAAGAAAPEEVAALRRWWPYARKVAGWLEDHNHYIDQASYGQLRLLLMAAGRRLAHRDVLEMQDDEFWLRREEIVAALRSAPPGSRAATVAARKAQHARWALLEAPTVMGTPEARLPARPPLADEPAPPAQVEEGRLAGQAASPGRRRGRARVILATTPVPPLLPGEVLVAENAGPLWTPVFPLLGGLILEHGAVTQHAATIAREYGVPAVVGVEGATRRIPEGAWVLVDGDRGSVELDLSSAERRSEDLP
jgi:pyruvate,water dikinase